MRSEPAGLARPLLLLTALAAMAALSILAGGPRLLPAQDVEADTQEEMQEDLQGYASEEAGAEPTPLESLEDRGRETFEVYCSSCHGLTAQGDGEVAALLKIEPADLTRIRQQHQGRFPWNKLYRIIDGRRPVLGHGSPDMPVWGMSFRERGLDADQEDMVRGRILQVLWFLRSIQVDEAGEPWPVGEAPEVPLE